MRRTLGNRLQSVFGGGWLLYHLARPAGRTLTASRRERGSGFVDFCFQCVVNVEKRVDTQGSV